MLLKVMGLIAHMFMDGALQCVCKPHHMLRQVKVTPQRACNRLTTELEIGMNAVGVGGL